MLDADALLNVQTTTQATVHTHACVCMCTDDGCEESFVYRDCISCCPPTCTFEKECLGTNLHCLDGCYCPDGI